MQKNKYYFVIDKTKICCYNRNIKKYFRRIIIMKMNEKLDIMLSRRHLKRVEFAESIGITYRAFAYYMTGSRKPRKSVLERMAAKLEVTPEFLLDDNIDMELTIEEKFLNGISSKGGSTTDAVKFLAQSRGLFAGNALSDKDKDNLLACLNEIYLDARKNNKNEK